MEYGGPTYIKLFLGDGPTRLYWNKVMLTYLEACQLKFRNRSNWLIWFPKDLLTDVDPKSTPSHGNCIPLPTTFEESVVGNFHHLQGLENKIRELEVKNFHIWYAMYFLKVTILTDCPFPSFWSELPNCEEQNLWWSLPWLKYLVNLFWEKENWSRNGALNSHYCGHR